MSEHLAAFISDLSGERGSMVPWVTNCYVGSTSQKDLVQGLKYENYCYY